VQATVIAAVLGLSLTVIGVQTGGLWEPYAVLAWAAGAVAFGGLAFSLIASVATREVEEDSEFSA